MIHNNNNDQPINGLSNKELLVRVLDRLNIIDSKIDTKADRGELQAMHESIRASALATKTSAEAEMFEVRQQVSKKVNRGEMFGWFGVVGTALTVTLAILL